MFVGVITPSIKLPSSKFIKGTNISKKYNTKKIENNKWKKMIDKLPKIDDENNIKLIKNKYSHGNIFQARFTDIAIFIYHMDKKYKNLYTHFLYQRFKMKG